MSNIYYYVYDDKYLLDIEINRLIEKEEVDSFNITKYVFTEENPLEILNDINTPTFFDEKKMVIIYEPEFLNPSYKNKDVINLYKNLFYSEPSTIVVICQKGSINSNEMISTLRKNANYFEIKSYRDDELKSFIINRITNDGYIIDDQAVEIIIERTEGVISDVINEIEKLENYKADTKKIGYSDADILIAANIEDDIYELLNAFIIGDTKRVIKIYDDFMAINTDELRIMNAIINKLEEILYTKVLLEEGLNKDEIASYFGVKPGRAYYMMQNAKNFNKNKLLSVIDKINDLDYKIKSGKIDKSVGLELFLLGA